MAKTAQNVIDAVRLKVNEPQTTFLSDANLLDMIDIAQQEIAIDTLLFRSKWTVDSEDGTAKYALPADFLAVEDVTFDGKQLYPTSIEVLNRSTQTWRDDEGEPTHYLFYGDLDGKYVLLYKIPDENYDAKTIAVYGKEIPTAPTVVGDNVLNSGKDPWLVLLFNALVYHVSAQAQEALEEPEMAVYFMGRYEKSLEKVMAAHARNIIGSGGPVEVVGSYGY